MTMHSQNDHPQFAVVVNDNPAQLDMLAGKLRKAGIEPHVFAGAEAALAALDGEHPPALIVTDLYMPGIDGWRFCRLLRSPEYAAFNQIPILVVSATFSGDDAARIATDLGAEAFLPSQLDGQRFCQQVRAALNRERLPIPPRILIVDDDDALCDLLKKLFSINGYEVETALTLRSASEAFGKNVFDVAVLDYHLSDGFGDVLLDEFRALRPDCVCLMITSDTDTNLAVKWMRKGAAAYLCKPFQAAYLIELCARARRERALLRVQDLLELRTRELRQSEAFARNVINSLSAQIAVLDENGVIVAVNEAWKRFAMDNGGKSDDVHIGVSYFSVCQTAIDSPMSELASVALQGIRSVMNGAQSSFSLEYPCHSAAEQRWFCMNVRPLGERPMWVVVAHENITERKRVEIALRESEDAALRKNALLRSIMESPLDIIIFALDTHYHYTMFAQAHKRAMKAIWGTDIELGMNMLNAITNPIDREKARKNFDRALQGEHFISIEEYGDPALFRTVFKDRYNPILGDGGVVSGLTVFVNDITERKRAEQETKNALALLEASISQSPSGILIADAPDVTIRWANAAALSIRGETNQPLTGIKVAQHTDHWQTFRPDGTVYPSEDLPLSRAVLKGEITHNEELIIHNVKGEDRWVSVNAAPIYNQDGAITAGLVIFHDITEHKRTEAEKSKLEGQLHQAKKMELVGRLAGGVAHDFNNMIQVIIGNADLALDRISPASPIRECLDEIQNSAQRAADMTRQLLGFARQQTIMPKVLDFNESVEGLLKLMRRLIGENIDLIWKPAAGLGLVKVDPTQINQILTNLCVNARDAIAGVGEVIIETEGAVFDQADCAEHPGFIPGDYVMLAVSDNGCGMDKETQARIFEPFFTTKGVGKGTGLGLATVYGIVKQNNGFITVYSEPNMGTTFKVYLPRHTGQAAAFRTESASPPPKSCGETVLLVEDDLPILSSTQRILNRLGYTVLTASTPSEAIRLAEAHTGEIHLLITDVVMPDMNGLDLSKRLLSRNPKLKCLFMSGHTADVIADHGVLNEGVCFVHKPFTTKDLASNIRKTLDQ